MGVGLTGWPFWFHYCIVKCLSCSLLQYCVKNRISEQRCQRAGRSHYKADKLLMGQGSTTLSAVFNGSAYQSRTYSTLRRILTSLTTVIGYRSNMVSLFILLLLSRHFTKIQKYYKVDKIRTLTIRLTWPQLLKKKYYPFEIENLIFKISVCTAKKK